MIRDRTEGSRTDHGAVLILVLLLVVIASLIVLPLMRYTTTVLQANRVVSERSKQLEAAKGGLRVVLKDPRNVFLECDNGGNLSSPQVNSLNVSVTCSELDEIGPLEALGMTIPAGATAMQLGASVPNGFSGTLLESPPVPPIVATYPANEDWWAGQVSHSAEPVSDSIWLPDLPQYPSTLRTPTTGSTGAFDMPAGYACKVYFPGRYTQPITLSSGRHYFTSGVYYFVEPVTVSGTADVVVGYGLEEFTGSDCADDIQVAANVIGNPGTYDINGGGATWVFGGNGRLVVDDTAGGAAPKIRFNQRYGDPDRGGRVSIMTVNGDTITSDHDVVKVNQVPYSQVVTAVPGTPVTYTDHRSQHRPTECRPTPAALCRSDSPTALACRTLPRASQ